MKTKNPLVRAGTLLLAACLFISTAAPAADDLNKLYEQGRAAFYQGDIPTAKKLLGYVLQMDPRHVPTRAILATIAANEKKGDISLKEQYARVSIPKFEVNQGTLSECLEALTLMAGKVTEGKVKPNFVVKSPELNQTPITLNMTNTPLDELVRYLAEMTKGKVTWDKHAVVFTDLTQ